MDLRACEETLTASPLSASSSPPPHTRPTPPTSSPSSSSSPPLNNNNNNNNNDNSSAPSPFTGRRAARSNSSSSSSSTAPPSHTCPPCYCATSAPPCAKRRRVSDRVSGSASGSASACTHALWHLAQRDCKHVPSRQHLRGSGVSALMREQVVAWSREMADFLRLPIGTVAIAINLFDRFVDGHRVAKNVLYALTAACVLIACKQLVDLQVPVDVIARRASTNRADIALLEPLVLNGLQWRVNVVTAYEVCLELAKKFDDAEKRGTLLDTLVLNCLMDEHMAWVRATSVGVGCFLVTSLFMSGDRSHRKHAVYAYARWCGVDMQQVDYCVERLQASIACMFDQVDEEEEEEEEEEEVEEVQDQDGQRVLIAEKGAQLMSNSNKTAGVLCSLREEGTRLGNGTGAFGKTCIELGGF